MCESLPRGTRLFGREKRFSDAPTRNTSYLMEMKYERVLRSLRVLKGCIDFLVLKNCVKSLDSYIIVNIHKIDGVKIVKTLHNSNIML